MRRIHRYRWVRQGIAPMRKLTECGLDARQCHAFYQWARVTCPECLKARKG